MKYRTELLNEIRERVLTECGEDLPFEAKKYSYGISSETYTISTDRQVEKYGKAKGIYDIFSLPNILTLTNKQCDYLVRIVSQSLVTLLGDIDEHSKILVVGLGNRHISSDSLGSRVCHNINITLGLSNYPNVMALCPSVLGLTGIETFDIIKGVVDRVKPTNLILIDSLCASSISRLSASIQLSNTGMCPGSGVGNSRRCIDKSICPNIVSIGVPLLIYISTFIIDTFERNNVNLDRLQDIMHSIGKSSKDGEILQLLKDIKNIYNDDIDGVVVSHKDIDEMVVIMSDIISRAINKSLGIEELKS